MLTKSDLRSNLDETKFDIQIISNADVRLRTDWNPHQLVEWLLGSHIHFILTHIHQGLEGCAWNMDELYQQVQRLKHHPGFPCGDALQCPIFTQDKFEYIKSVPQLCNPTLAIVLTADGCYEDPIISHSIET